MGGEPLLHPLINYIIEFARLKFSKTEITVLTNGLLLNSMSGDFWYTCKDNNVRVAMSYYPIDTYVHTAAVKIKAKTFGVKFKEFSGAKTFERTINIKGNSDPQKAINFCRGDIAKLCPILFNGRLYHCSLTAFVHIFNNHFKKNIPQPDGIDITDSDMYDDRLLSILSKPCETCRFCLTESVPTTWGLSKKDIKEWI
jgi:hypothetical protein